MWGYIIVLLPERPLSFQRIWRSGLSILASVRECAPELSSLCGMNLVHLGTSTNCFGSVISIIPPRLSVAPPPTHTHTPPHSLDPKSESLWPSWNSLVLFGLFVSLESLVLCLLESVGFQSWGSLPENKTCDCLVFFCNLVVGERREEIFQISHKTKPCLNFSFAFPCALSSSFPSTFSGPTVSSNK